jgi:hypothetical protein
MHRIRNFHEGPSLVGEWQGSGTVMAGERHGMCESAFILQYHCVTIAYSIQYSNMLYRFVA